MSITSKTDAVSFSSAPPSLISAWKRKRSIGIISPSYGTEKVSYGLRPDAYSFHKLFRVPVHRLEKNSTFWKNTPLLMDYPVELVHGVNELPWGIRPFVVSFENELPRYFGKVRLWQAKAGLDLLESGRCRKILALSDIAAESLRGNLRGLGAGGAVSKVGVFRGAVRPPAPTAPRDRPPRPATRPLRVLFVGREAIGKGLPPVLDALDDCRALGIPIEATIVCDFRVRSRISQCSADDVARLVARMRAQPGTTHHFLLPNAEIHQLMHSHDILLLPTLDESLGWVAVEAGLAGMAVIATDVFAIPELVLHGRTGFLIPLKKNEQSRWVGLWLEGSPFQQALDEAFASIREHLALYLQHFADHPDLLETMGAAGKAHLERLYSASEARRQLGEIYRNAIER